MEQNHNSQSIVKVKTIIATQTVQLVNDKSALASEKGKKSASNILFQTQDFPECQSHWKSIKKKN